MAKKMTEAQAMKEAEKIFMKLNPQYAKTGYPKVNASNLNTPYGKEAMRIQKQVLKVRLGKKK
jgi:hypothetical protein